MLGPTSTSKVLHLICPELFPMWDDAIRRWIRSECGLKRLSYLKFMEWCAEIISEYEDRLHELSQRWYLRSKLKVLDEFLWMQAPRDRKSMRDRSAPQLR